jgi:MFS family permease
MMPWSVKLLYGVISDNVPLFGSKRRSYVILMGALQFLSLVSIFLFQITNEKTISALLFLSALSGAYLDVLVDALMVIQSRQDEEEGSEQLQSLSWAALGAGGMTGSLVGAYVTEYLHPKWSFLAYSIFGLIVMLLGFNLNPKVEVEEGESREKERKSLGSEFCESLN